MTTALSRHRLLAVVVVAVYAMSSAFVLTHGVGSGWRQGELVTFFAVAVFLVGLVDSGSRDSQYLSSAAPVMVVAWVSIPPGWALLLPIALLGGAAFSSRRQSALAWLVLGTKWIVSLTAAVSAIALMGAVPMPGFGHYALVAAAGCAAFVAGELVYLSTAATVDGWPWSRAAVETIRFNVWLAASEVCLAVLGVLIVRSLGLVGYAPLVVFGLLMRQSVLMVQSMRDAYSDTIAALVRAVEVQDADLAGHGQRVALEVVRQARRAGLSGERVSRLEYAALLHAFSAVEARGANLDAASARTPLASDIVCEISYLRAAVPVLRILESGTADPNMPTDLVSDALLVAQACAGDQGMLGSTWPCVHHSAVPSCEAHLLRSRAGGTTLRRLGGSRMP